MLIVFFDHRNNEKYGKINNEMLYQEIMKLYSGVGAVLWQSGWGYILPVWPCLDLSGGIIRWGHSVS